MTISKYVVLIYLALLTACGGVYDDADVVGSKAHARKEALNVKAEAIQEKARACWCEALNYPNIITNDDLKIMVEWATMSGNTAVAKIYKDALTYRGVKNG